MPVLDAKALKTDPKGMAFLLSVLRQSRLPRISPKKTLQPNPSQVRAAEERDGVLQDIV